MRRANYWTGVLTITAGITLALLASGCTRDDSVSNSGSKSALTASTVGDRDLPEVVVSTRRPARETIAMSDRDADAATGIPSTPSRRP
jgi:hypothetical protein